MDTSSLDKPNFPARQRCINDIIMNALFFPHLPTPTLIKHCCSSTKKSWQSTPSKYDQDYDYFIKKISNYLNSSRVSL